MKTKTGIFVTIGLVVAVAVAVGSTLYLLRTKEAVERVIKPVELVAPDLFPADTLLYAEVKGWDRSFADAEAWWKEFEPTATWYQIHHEWETDRKSFPPELVDAIESIDKELDRAQQKFGYRPTTRDFWETYGKHTAFALLPTPKGEKFPFILAATRLPQGGTEALLKEKMGKASDVHPCEPPMHRGFPMFQEEHEGTKLIYGVGRGYLFASNSLPAVRQALDRLAVAYDSENPVRPTGTLAEDPVLRRVCPTPGKDRLVFYVKRDQKFGELKEDLKVVDEYLRDAFVLAPKDSAVAFALGEAPSTELRCSFGGGALPPWTRSLPSGMHSITATVPASAEDVRRMIEPDVKAFFDKPLWKEIDAFLNDPKRIQEFVREAVPPGDAPPPEILERLPNDVRLAGRMLRSAADSLMGVSSASFMLGEKAYPDEEGNPKPQYAYGIDLDPFTIFLLAGALDMGQSKAPDWISRTERHGLLIWSLNTKRVWDEIERNERRSDAVEMMKAFYGHIRPSLLIMGNRLILLTGKDLLDEIVSLAAGGGATRSMEEDALFDQARKQVRPGYMYFSFHRPPEEMRALWSYYRGAIDMGLSSVNERMDENVKDGFRAALGTVDDVIGWTSRTPAEMTAIYPDDVHPSEFAQIIDPQAEARVPLFEGADAPLRVTDFLPADTWLVLMQRMDLKAAYDAMRAAFVKRLPGGEDRLERMFPSDDQAVRDFQEIFVEGLLRNVKGEAGFAVALPRLGQEELKFAGPRAFIARAPAVILFSQFDRPDAAFKSFETILTRVHGQLNPRPFRDMMRDYRLRRGELPAGSELTVNRAGTLDSISMDFYIPFERDHVVVSVRLLKRGDWIFITNSDGVFNFLSAVMEGGPESLAARMARDLPKGALPDRISALRLFRGDAIADQLQLLAEPLIPQAATLTLRGYGRNRPPQERFEAHQEGWKRYVGLALDLLRFSRWNVAHTSRTGNVVKRIEVQVPEKR